MILFNRLYSTKIIRNTNLTKVRECKLGPMPCFALGIMIFLTEYEDVRHAGLVHFHREFILYSVEYGYKQELYS